MKILGIETSCDETAVCLIHALGDFDRNFHYRILGNALYSQADIHAHLGGVFPNLAKREHAKTLVPLTELALKDAAELRARPAPQLDLTAVETLLEREPELYKALSWFVQIYDKPDIDAIAVTKGPGLEPALWVGVNFARALAMIWQVPLIAVNHLEGHIVMAAMDESAECLRSIEYPLLALTISGGHTQLDLSREWMHYETIGQTRDDAVGEAYDKVARMLGFHYPGGPHIAKLAEQARSAGGIGQFRFPRPMLNQDNYDFSFSGLKTEVRKHISENMTDETKVEIARAFEDAVSDVLVGKTIRAVEEFGIQTVVVGGGVSANSFIKENLARGLSARGIPLLAPSPALATDNALMIALAGYFHALSADFTDIATLKADGNFKLGSK